MPAAVTLSGSAVVSGVKTGGFATIIASRNSMDAQVKYQGALYKADAVIPAPAGNFDADKWTLQGSDSTSDYDNWHCNVLGYKKLADKVEAWMRGL